MASNRKKKQKACTGKIKHKTFKLALDHAKFLSRSEKWITPYKCKFCGYFHVGHAPYWIRRRLINKALGMVKNVVNADNGKE